MAIEAGTRLGPYELIALIGAGGMGEVYRARDTRLGREVAVKVLPRDVAEDPERLRRFSQEARAAGALNHPNILSVHDLGEEDGVAYLVTELLEGETLRRRMGGAALPARKAVEYAVQIAEGLAAAHAARIVHRDLKPDNLFVTRDGRIKILDFGLAKLETGPAAGEVTQTMQETLDPVTTPGTVLGTIGYLAPEQVRGEPADHRSDIFAFGTILYEMLSGRRAFRAATKVETMTAILREEPESLASAEREIDPGLERIVRHCLEKSPDERFQSARDLAFHLGEVSSLSETAVRSGPLPAAPRRRLALRAGVAVVLLLAAALVAGFFIGARGRESSLIDYRQLTFRRGTITAARFAPSSGGVVYSAIWEGQPAEIFSTSLGNPESRPLGLSGAGLLGISRSGEMAVALRLGPITNGFERVGTLANLPIATSTAPRELLEYVRWADWGSEGTELCVVRAKAGGARLEYPIGTTLAELDGWISHPRVSPDGRQVAFIEHPQFGDDRGFVAVVDREGHQRRIGRFWATLWGLAWRPDGKEIWFTGGPDAALAVRRLYAVTLDGTLRQLAIGPGEMTLHDVSPTGDVLLAVEDRRRSLLGMGPGETSERNLTWLDRSVAGDLTPDGGLLLFHEGGKAGSGVGSIYTRKMDGSPAVRLSEGYARRFSPDGKWVLSVVPTVPRRWRLVPTAAGTPRDIEIRGLEAETVELRGFAADNRRFVAWGAKTGEDMRAWIYDPDDGECTPLGPQGAFPEFVAGDGRHAVLTAEAGRRWVVPTAGGEARPIAGLRDGDTIVGMTADARMVYTAVSTDRDATIWRVDVATGARERLRVLNPPNRAGLAGVGNVAITPDGEHYVYGYTQQLSELYLAQGIQ